MRTFVVTTLLAAGAALAAGTLVACGDKQEEAPPAQPRLVRVFQVAGAGGPRLSFPGTVQARDRAELSFRVTGPLVQLPVNEGDRVEAGQLLAKMDPRDFRIAVDEARAAFDKAESDLKRFQRLYEREAVPLSELELARSQRDAAKARLDQAQADLRDTDMKAPFAGWIGRRFVENAEQVSAHQSVMTVHDLAHLEIVVDVPQDVMANVRGRADDAVAKFSATGDREYPVTVKEFSAEADPTTRTYQVTFALPAPEEAKILPGMTAQVVGRAAGDAAGGTFAVPLSGVVGGDGGDPYVWVVSPENTVARRSVTVGQVMGGGSIEVLSGLQAGEMVVTSAVNLLEEGMEVRTMEGR